MKIHTLSIGRPRIVLRGGHQYSTSIDRRPVTQSVHLDIEGFTGDRVSDNHMHGGPDKAVLCFPLEHYAYFIEKLGRDMPVPAFGENLTTQDWTEETACVGDTLQIGTAIVQVSQPRQPCFKLASKHNEPRMIRWVIEKAWSGFYIRVLTPGEVTVGDDVKLVERPHPGLTMVALTRLLHEAEPDRTTLERVVAAPELAESWRRQTLKRLSMSLDDPEFLDE